MPLALLMVLLLKSTPSTLSGLWLQPSWSFVCRWALRCSKLGLPVHEKRSTFWQRGLLIPVYVVSPSGHGVLPSCSCLERHGLVHRVSSCRAFQMFMVPPVSHY